MFDFPKTVDDLSTVPDIYQGLYGPAEDGFALDPALAEKLDVTGLTSALEKERKSAAALEKELRLWRQIADDPEAALTRSQEMEATLHQFETGAQDRQERELALTAEVNAVIAEKDSQIDQLKQQNREFLITTEATAAILTAKGSPELLMPHIRLQVSVVEEEGALHIRIAGDDGEVRVNEDGGYLSLKELVSEMRSSPIFARAFDPVGSRGSGMDPASLPLHSTQLNGHDARTVNARIEDIATGRVAVTL
jgi:hypothetical protein